MAQGLIKKETLSSIAEAIREKSGTETQYLPSEMAAAIRAIPSGGGGSSFLWGDLNTVGDEQWWLSLQQYVQTTNPQDLESYLGYTKKVSFNNSETQTIMRVIGANIDGQNTLTFDTLYPYGNTTSYGTSSIYEESTVKGLCDSFAEACSASKAIKEMTLNQYKGEPYVNPGKDNEPDSTFQAKVFLLSMAQMNSPGYGACPNEFTVANESKTPYPLYTVIEDRGKVLEGTTSKAAYWSRSRYGNRNDSVCRIVAGGTDSYQAYNNSSNNRIVPCFVIG